MVDLLMSRSCATMQREYEQIGSLNSGGRAVSLYLHNDKHHAAAVYAEPEDVNGQLRHRHLAQLDFDVQGRVLVVLDQYVTAVVETAGVVHAMQTAIAGMGYTLLTEE